MMTQRITSVILLTFVTVFLTGCHFIPDEELYNNTGIDVTVTTFTLISDDDYNALTNDESMEAGHSYKLKRTQVQNGRYTFHYELENTLRLEDGGTKRLGVPYKIEIQKGTKSYNYEIHWVPLDFYGSAGGNLRVARFQLQSDGSIYLLSPNTIAPATNFPVQPTTFPLKPL